MKPSQKRFHSVCGASISKFLLRKTQLDSQLDQESGIVRSRSITLNRGASVGVREIVAKLDILVDGRRGRKDSVREIEVCEEVHLV